VCSTAVIAPHSALRNLARSFVNSEYKRGLRGQPCFKPLYLGRLYRLHVGRTSSQQSLFGGQCTPSVISVNFAVVLSWAAIRVGCPKLQGSLFEVHNKTTEVNGFTVPQLLNVYFCTRPVMAETIWEDQQSSDLELSLNMSACKTCLVVGSAVAMGQRIVKTHCGTKPVEL
jgi:hypothetical protein